jgi:hypothetical protein
MVVVEEVNDAAVVDVAVVDVEETGLSVHVVQVGGGVAAEVIGPTVGVVDAAVLTYPLMILLPFPPLVEFWFLDRKYSIPRLTSCCATKSYSS